jgi:hypothetical protein
MEKEKNESRVFELLAEARAGVGVTSRDDQNDFFAFLDSAKLCRRTGGRFRLIDTGKFSLSELEWLGEAGADVYASDEVRPDKTQVELLVKACGRGGGIVAYFHHGAIIRNKDDDPTSLSFLLELGRSGAYVHLSNRVKERGLDDLNELALVCRKAGSRFVYYHHGRPSAGFEELSRNGAWIHLSDERFEFPEDRAVLLNVLREARGAGGGLVLHIEKGLELELLRDVLRAGAFVLFKTPLADLNSPFRLLERQARRRTLDFRAYYLYTSILP